MNVNRFKTVGIRSRRYRSTKTISNADYPDDPALLANKPAQVIS